MVSTPNDQSTPEQTQQPGSRIDTLQHLAAVACRHASGQVDAFSARLSAAMLTQSEQANDGKQANLIFNAGNLLKNNQYPFFHLLTTTLDQALQQQIQDLQHVQQIDTLQQQAELSLVSYQEMETQMALNKACRAFELDSDEQLKPLNRRLSTLLEPDWRHCSNPFRPQTFLDATYRAWCEFDPDPESHPLVLSFFQPEIFFDLKPIFRALNDALIARGIQPELQNLYSIKKSNGNLSAASTSEASETALAKQLKALFAPPEASATGASAAAAALPIQPGMVLPLDPGMVGAQLAAASPLFNFLGNIQRDAAQYAASMSGQGPIHPGHVVGGVNPASQPAGAAAPAASDAWPALYDTSQIQQTLAANGLMTSLPGGFAALPGLRLVDIRKQVPQGTLSHVDETTINLLTKVFDNVTHEKNIPEQIKDLINLLQIPVLKAALIDQEFFYSAAHPARRLIEVVAKSSVGWDQSKGEDDPLYQTIKRNVHRVHAEFDQEIELFADVLADIEAFIKQEEEQASTALHAPIEQALKQEKIREATRSATNEVALRVNTGELVTFVETFLENKWVPVLAFAYTMKDDKPHVLVSAVKTMDELIWSVKPKFTAEQRKELITKLPSLLATLNKWLKLVKWDDADRLRFFADLAECHASIVRAPLELSPQRQLEIAMQVAQQAEAKRQEKAANAAPDTVPDEFVYTVDTLERGLWMEFLEKDGGRKKVKLAWVSPQRSLYIFSGRKQEEAFSMSNEDLTQAFREQRVDVLKLDQFVDRALAQAVGVDSVNDEMMTAQMQA